MSRRSYKGATKYGSGTYDDPFLIWDINDLIECKNVLAGESVRVHSTYHDIYVNIGASGQYFKLMDDIDVSSVCGSNIGNFRDSGDGQTTTLGGDFDGNNHTISNLYNYYSTIGQNDWSKTDGLFNNLLAGSRCHHLILNNVTAYGRYGGGITAVNRGLIDHCKVLSGTVAGWQGGGGIAGWCGDGGIIEHCENWATTIKASWAHTVPILGGIVGTVGNSSYIRYNINHADLSFNTGTSNNVGGICGHNAGSSTNTATILNNINFGDFFCNSSCNGGIDGSAQAGAIQGNMFVGNMTSSGGTSGAILGQKQSSNAFNVYCNLNLGTTYNTSNSIYPINYQGDNNSNYPNYFITEFNRITSTKTGVIGCASSDLVCTADDTIPSIITNTTFFNKNNFVFKKGFYPYPKGIENTDACLCAAAYIKLPSGCTCKTVNDDIELGGTEGYAEGITWTSSDTSKMTIERIRSGLKYKYIGEWRAAGSVVITNWKNGVAYKKISLTLV